MEMCIRDSAIDSLVIDGERCHGVGQRHTQFEHDFINHIQVGALRLHPMNHAVHPVSYTHLLQALFDRSDGFYRRQLVLTTKEKPAGRVDDPDLAEKMKAEVEGILLWAFEGLQRPVSYTHLAFLEFTRYPTAIMASRL